MIDREKIIMHDTKKAIEQLDWYFQFDNGCAAEDITKTAYQILKKALKAQEQVKPVMRTAHAQGANDVWYECSGCGGYLGIYRNSKKLCDKCGRAVKWNG